MSSAESDPAGVLRESSVLSAGGGVSEETGKRRCFPRGLPLRRSQPSCLNEVPASLSPVSRESLFTRKSGNRGGSDSRVQESALRKEIRNLNDFGLWSGGRLLLPPASLADAEAPSASYAPSERRRSPAWRGSFVSVQGSAIQRGMTEARERKY
jgi:hypothetical protein